jgi:hypothetical protein
MALKKGVEVKPAKGKLGILMPGMGAVATTFIAGVQAIRRGIGKPIGSLTQLGHIRVGKRTDNNSPAIKDYVSLATLDDIVFGGWDIFTDNAYQAAVRAGVLESKDLEPLKEELEAIKPMTAVFEQAYVKKLNGPNVKKGTSKKHLAEQLMEDIKQFKATNARNFKEWRTYQMSDHLIMWTQFDVDKTDTYLDEVANGPAADGSTPKKSKSKKKTAKKAIAVKKAKAAKKKMRTPKKKAAKKSGRKGGG